MSSGTSIIKQRFAEGNSETNTIAETQTQPDNMIMKDPVCSSAMLPTSTVPAKAALSSCRSSKASSPTPLEDDELTRYVQRKLKKLRRERQQIDRKYQRRIDDKVDLFFSDKYEYQRMMNLLDHERKIELDEINGRIRDEKHKLAVVADMRCRILAATTRVDEETNTYDSQKDDCPTNDPYEIWNGGWRDFDKNAADRKKMQSLIKDLMLQRVGGSLLLPEELVGEKKALVAAKLLEEGLYRIAKSLEEYKEMFSLERRTDELILYMEERHQMKKDQELMTTIG